MGGVESGEEDPAVVSEAQIAKVAEEDQLANAGADVCSELDSKHRDNVVEASVEPAVTGPESPVTSTPRETLLAQVLPAADIGGGAKNKDASPLQADSPALLALAPCLALPAEAPTASTAESSAGELSSRSSHNAPAVDAAVDAAGAEEEKASDVDLGLDGQGCAMLATIPGDICQPLQLQDSVETEREDGGTRRLKSGSEIYLAQMLAGMDFHLRHLRPSQQWLVAMVEMACRWALGNKFKMLSLVGSVALCVETPGSDVDVVCFTQPNGSEGQGLVGNNLRLIQKALQSMISQHPGGAACFSLKLIEDAKVPIMRVNWGPPGQGIAVDVLVDQRRPLDHVHWFQRIGAVPSPTATAQPAVMLVAMSLRCVKWWVRRRQLPPTREGGLPTLTWLLLALHSGSTVEALPSQPMTQIVASLAAFFHTYSALGGLDGTLTFQGGCNSDFVARPKSNGSPWAELSVMDPTQKASENAELAPKLLPATQLLISYELRRASALLAGSSEQEGMRQLFEPVLEGNNSLPRSLSQNIGAILLLGDPCKGVGTIELGIIERVSAHPEWKAPFLHRSDTRSEIHVRLLDIDENTWRCYPRRKGAELVLCPCHFVRRVSLRRSNLPGRPFLMDDEEFETFTDMRRYLSELHAHQQAQNDHLSPQT